MEQSDSEYDALMLAYHVSEELRKRLTLFGLSSLDQLRAARLALLEEILGADLAVELRWRLMTPERRTIEFSTDSSGGNGTVSNAGRDIIVHHYHSGASPLASRSPEPPEPELANAANPPKATVQSSPKSPNTPKAPSVGGQRTSRVILEEFMDKCGLPHLAESFFFDAKGKYEMTLKGLGEAFTGAGSSQSEAHERAATKAVKYLRSKTQVRPGVAETETLNSIHQSLWKGKETLKFDCEEFEGKTKCQLSGLPKAVLGCGTSQVLARQAAAREGLKMMAAMLK